MRGKKAAMNTAFSLLEEVISVVCGFILPRLILSAFGSKYNGLTSSITQFLSCAILLRSGIGGATRAALYKPLAQGDHDRINGIVAATDRFMKRIGLILACAILVFASIYPFLVSSDFGWLFTFSLFVIIGASTFAESFFGVTYLIVLQADQRLWVSSMLKCICYVLNTVIGALLITNGFSIHVVKLGSAAVYVAYPILLGAYVKRAYRINTNVEPDNRAIVQRWDAFWHQVAVFVMNNTDVMVLTFFTNMLEVSVYSVYNMIVNGLKRGMAAFSNGLEGAFGNMIAKGEEKALRENLVVIETLIYGIGSIVYACAAVLILDFVQVYTKAITDVNYIRPGFALVIILAQFMNGARIPYQLVVQAAGHYRQTRNGAVFEAVLNIVISVILVQRCGLVGVAVGTLCATVLRTVQYYVYMSRHIVRRSPWALTKRLGVSLLSMSIVFIVGVKLPFSQSQGYLDWVIRAAVVFVMATVVSVGVEALLCRRELSYTVRKIGDVLHRKV